METGWSEIPGFLGRALRPLEKDSYPLPPQFRVPASETALTRTFRGHPAAGAGASPLRSPRLPAPAPRQGARAPAPWGRGAHVPAPPPPRQCPGEQRARPAGPLPLAPTLTRSPVSGRSAGPAGRRERARAEEEASSSSKFDRIFMLPAFMKLLQCRN
nr:wiskott-Aldrich syndrome protein homolog [Equus caballus]